MKVFRIRHVGTGEFLEKDATLSKFGKTFTSIDPAIRFLGKKIRKKERTNFEIAEYILTETGSLYTLKESGNEWQVNFGLWKVPEDSVINAVAISEFFRVELRLIDGRVAIYQATSHKEWLQYLAGYIDLCKRILTRDEIDEQPST